MREKTTSRYTALMLSYLAFLLRVKLGRIHLEEPLKLELPDSKAAATLIQALKSTDGNNAAVSAIHRLLMVTLCRQRANPFETTPSSFALFLIFKNTNLSGMIKRPEDISRIITEFKWPMRAAGFHEIVLRLRDIRLGVEGVDWQSEVEEVSVEGDSPILK